MPDQPRLVCSDGSNIGECPMPTPDLINLEATLAEITEYWRPRVIGADRACRRAAVAGG
jgi:hypothetical protein